MTQQTLPIDAARVLGRMRAAAAPVHADRLRQSLCWSHERIYAALATLEARALARINVERKACNTTWESLT